ncbi:UNVERIFIED_CONTAM: hypothetical protein Sangu_0330800 [Sesamum angustifolium]|uniref:Uncharacterized protein n=1 Tax=Sesamum angustifolium TaxID=2727405 RepID=A0AAW2QRE3_9LAMI
MDSGEIVVSSIRAGMKREFAMMMKAQSEMGGLPAGGRRMTRSQSTVGSSKGYVRSADKVSKKIKGSESKKIKKDEREKLGGEGVRRLEFDVLDCDKGRRGMHPRSCLM